MTKTRLLQYKAKNGIRAFRKWIVPYVQSHLHNSDFRPVLSYLYTDWKCNIDCHYCFQYDNKQPGMTLETARSSIDWLHSVGCRVLAIMGGEPLIRKDFIVDVIRYASAKDFFVYLPTNGYLLTPELIDTLGKAGVSAVNLAVDCVAPRPGLPKALMAVEPQFRYLVKQQDKYGYLVFFNINITSKNIRDVRMLTEIAHDNRVGTDYHINEPPFETNDVSHFTHERDGMCIRPEQYPEVDALLDWVIMKNRQGYTMVNSVAHLRLMKKWMRGNSIQWHCRAGHNGSMIRPDGSLSPCFGLMTYDHDWGRIWDPKFDPVELDDVRRHCHPRCFSTCFYTMGHYYQPGEVLKWMFKHMGTGSAV
jgi:MoaA/NifB/PqqE/SkfB family radical SAM enzyme